MLFQNLKKVYWLNLAVPSPLNVYRIMLGFLLLRALEKDLSDLVDADFSLSFFSNGQNISSNVVMISDLCISPGRSREWKAGLIKARLLGFNP